MSSITKPFDLLFKHTMGSDVALKDFLRAHLPKSLKGRIDLESIHPTKQSYVSAELRELHSDLVCTCKIDGKEALLYLIIEHQSKEVRSSYACNGISWDEKGAREKTAICH